MNQELSERRNKKLCNQIWPAEKKAYNSGAFRIPGSPLTRNKSTTSQETSAPQADKDDMMAFAALRCPPPVSEMINKIFFFMGDWSQPFQYDFMSLSIIIYRIRQLFRMMFISFVKMERVAGIRAK